MGNESGADEALYLRQKSRIKLFEEVVPVSYQE
jgi:hypothetical protein